MTYVAVGSHPIQVASGYFEKGVRGIVLTDVEAEILLRAGAVERDTEASPAAAPPSPTSTGLAPASTDGPE